MKKRVRKFVCMMLVLAFCTASVVGCGSKKDDAVSNQGEKENSSKVTEQAPKDDTKKESSSTTEQKEDNKLDTSKKVNLVFMFVGDEPQGKKEVLDAVNKKLEEKLNCTLDLQFTTWTDWSQKYNLALTSGQQLDLIYTANWTGYGNLASSGAFADLNEMFPIYAPELFEQEKGLIDQCKINGKLYAIPAISEEWPCNGYEYRVDLKEKYNLPTPDSLENVEAYLMGIKENEPDQQLITPISYPNSFSIPFSIAEILNLKYKSVSTAIPYGLSMSLDSPSVVEDYWYSDDFREDMKLLKRWADAGFWSRSALSNTDEDTFSAGQSVFRLGGLNMDKYAQDVKNIMDAGEDWKVDFITYGDVTGATYPGHCMQNASSIPAASKNKERTLMVLNYIMTDKEMCNLFQCGIKGVHYNESADSLYEPVDGTTFWKEAFNSWNFRNQNVELQNKTNSVVDLEAIKSRLREEAAKTKYPNVNIYGGFAENSDEYATERAALLTVIQQYLAPIQAGFVDDVDVAIDEFLEKAEKAGLEKCREGFKKQWSEYCKSHNYQ